MSNITHLEGDCRKVLLTLPDESVHTCITSPPYFGLRDYGCDGQIGLEKTPEEYVKELVDVFREVRRVLRKDGTFWLIIGDTYASQRGGSYMPAQTVAGGKNGKGEEDAYRGTGGEDQGHANRDAKAIGLKHKDLIGVPWMVAFALRADGWYLRQDIIWCKSNPLPESVTDRCTKCHEYIFLLSKSPTYYYDHEAVKEPCQSGPSDIKKMLEKKDRIDAKHFHVDPGSLAAANPKTNIGKKRGVGDPSGRNRRSVWNVPTRPYKGAHFAVYPNKLVEPCVMAGSSEKGCCPTCGKPWERIVERNHPNKVVHDGEWEESAEKMGITGTDGRNGRLRFGLDHKTALEKSPGYKTIGWKQTCKCEPKEPIPCTVIDPFGGSGTTGEVAKNLGRDCILIELNPEYVTLQKHRIEKSEEKSEKVGEFDDCDVSMDSESWRKWMLEE